MGVMPIGKLLFSMSAPMMLSMVIQACYNIIDSIFVAQLSENALNAVSLAFPLQQLMIAVCGGTAVGMNALLSRAIVRKRLRHMGIKKGFQVVFSEELPDKESIVPCEDRNKKSQVGTISYIPAVFGCVCAQAAVQHLMSK